MLIFTLVLGWALFAFALSFVFYQKTYAWLYETERQGIGTSVAPVLSKHFQNVSADQLVIVSREFPKRVHAELHRELLAILADKNVVRENGLETEFYNTIKLIDCLVASERQEVRLVPFVCKDIDVGEEEPLSCYQNGIWLWRETDVPMALLFAPAGVPHEPKGLRVEIGVCRESEAAIEEAKRIMKRLETAVKECPSYRRKILSLEASEFGYSGRAVEIKVHRLAHVEREQLVLPERTVDLLERNVFGFVRQRKQLKEFGLQTKKGLLFYGPPGTGKTHTLHYLIGRLKDEYTTMLITAEQVGELDEYFSLARLLEPAIVIIEDADIIARQRGEHSVCTETLLNKLLNEMDGLKEDADVLFLLTTNHPETLENALRNRPGRIDQAIEFPLPDAEGREKLARLYAKGLNLPPELLKEIVERTEGVSAAFIKELLRRSAQFLLERNASGRELAQADFEGAIDEMLHASGFGVLGMEK